MNLSGCAEKVTEQRFNPALDVDLVAPVARMGLGHR